jgi:hypothetical protein
MTQAVQTAQYGSTSVSLAFKNRIINGAMVIDQRNAGASVTPTATTYTLDRWQAVMIQASKFSVEQTITGVAAPTGFTDYLGVTSTSAYSVLTGDTFLLTQIIEGFNIADLGWGTANAQSVTLSFRVYSSLTGTFGGAITNGDLNRSYPFSYTISAANTWTTISITIAGDTTGTWLTNNGIGIRVRFGLGSGATFSGTAGAWAAGNLVQPTGTVSVVGTNGATFYITGVQLEKGTQATSYEYENYGVTLQKCQRYYYQRTDASVNTAFINTQNQSTTDARGAWGFAVTMRAAPTITSSAAGNFWVQTGGALRTPTAITGNSPTVDGTYLIITTSSLTLGDAGTLIRQTGTAFLAASAEL